MRRTPSSLFASALALSLLAALPTARAQQFKSRVMVILDTSGSMGFYFDDPQTIGTPVGGDWPGGDGSTSYSDTLVNNLNLFPGKAPAEGKKSRLYAAKAALNDALNAHAGNIDFGLETFDFQLCKFNAPQCEQCSGVLQNNTFSYNCLYTDIAFKKFEKVNWITQACTGPGGGGRILVQPGANSAARIFPWIDGVEIHKPSNDGDNSYGTGSTPVNPEIRAEGNTPLAESLYVAQNEWFNKVKGGDQFIACRPYAVILATDGEQSVNGGCGADPAQAATALYKLNPGNPVLTYVIGIGTNGASLNNIAAAGGTGAAKFANSQAAIATAFADIAQASVKFEVCNNRDDNCNGNVDEGFDRAAACKVGIGECEKSGIKKCTLDGGATQCCVNDGNPNTPCVPLVAGNPRKEFCNGLDDDCNNIIDDPPVCGMCKPVAETCNNMDDDCDGVVDNAPVDVDLPCGLNLGVCKPGKTTCFAGKLSCLGATAPKAEACNNLDDDCDGVIDGMTRPCYSGPLNTDGNGICRGGEQRCSAGVFGGCSGEVLPKAELCNGIDDNCNGKVDDAPGTGMPCCPSGKCGVGACANGSQQCSGGSVQCLGGLGPEGEICDGKDNDCNGKVDDLVGIGKACTPQGGCGGQLACDIVQHQVTCQPIGMMGKELCNGIDDDCDGLVDEKDPDIINDPKIAQPCGNDKALPLPCLAGKTICKLGMVVCVGALGPQTEVCDGQDNDCDGTKDNGAPCPNGFQCYNGTCDPNCGPGEFPCPGGFSVVVVNGKCLCAPDQICNPPCQMPLFCKAGKCVDRCDGINCKAPLQCVAGDCLGCEKFGCPMMCTRCEKATHECVPDKCCNVVCKMGQFCEQATGQCRGTCVPPCGADKVCQDGTCIDTPCANVQCANGEVCNQMSGKCEQNKCAFIQCGVNLACCMERCQADPCLATKCPDGSVCRLDQLTCMTRCDVLDKGPEDKVVAAGGAFACSVSSRRSDGPARFAALALLVVALLRRRRR